MTVEMMPAAFLGHGSPMNALARNRYTEAWRELGNSISRPRAILVISAHWYVNLSALTAMTRPRTIHDFYGFPSELFEVQYAAPGDPALAEEISEIVKPTWVGLDRDSWGLDHGTWSVLTHAFPAADIPVVQLSINAQQPLSYHFDLGASLAPLRERDVLIVGSGNVVHNLRRIDWNQPETGFGWARRFNDAARQYITESPTRIVDLADHPDFAHAVPTPDHFIPLLYLAGLAAEAGATGTVLVDGYTYGSLSMTSYTLGARCPQQVTSAAAGAPMPSPARVAPENTNT